MGVYYYVVSHKSTKEMVENNDFEAIEKFIQNPETFHGPLRNLSPDFMRLGSRVAKDEYAWIYGVYQIASRAVQLGNKEVLKKIGDRIPFDYPLGGNEYDLFVLATEKHQFEMIDLLWEFAIENCYYAEAASSLEYATRRLLGYSQLSEKEVIDVLGHYGNKEISLKEIYGFTKSWDRPLVRKYLLDNYYGQLEIKEGDENYDPEKNLLEVPNFIKNYGKECWHKKEIRDFAGGQYQFDDWECDKCDKSFPKGTKRWLCKLCNSDICLECHQN